jgi:hypothetical protein
VAAQGFANEVVALIGLPPCCRDLPEGFAVEILEQGSPRDRIEHRPHWLRRGEMKAGLVHVALRRDLSAGVGQDEHPLRAPRLREEGSSDRDCSWSAYSLAKPALQGRVVT